jgi:hypothetical protein
MLIIFAYVVDDLILGKKLHQLYGDKVENYADCGFEFLKELYKMADFYKSSGIRSSLVVFETPKLTGNDIAEIERFKRTLDLMCYLKDKNLLIFVLPFTAPLNAGRFVERITEKFDYLKPVKIFLVEKPELDFYLKKLEEEKLKKISRKEEAF